MGEQTMAESTLAKKMKRAPAARAALIHAPAGYEAASFAGFAPAATVLSGHFDWIQIFVENKAELDQLAPKATKCLNPDSILWISFPKGTSRIQTDLTRDKGWENLEKLHLKWITLISVNETWSAFSLRPYKPGEAHQAFR
jgi:hypothetical protein